MSRGANSAMKTARWVSMAVEKGAKTAVVWLLFTLAPFPLGRGCSLRTARSGQGRAGVARRSEPFTARTVLRSSTRGKGVALNGPLKWPSRSPPLTLHQIQPTGTGRHKVAYKAGMLLQPRLHVRHFVRAVVVHH